MLTGYAAVCVVSFATLAPQSDAEKLRGTWIVVRSDQGESLRAVGELIDEVHGKADEGGEEQHFMAFGEDKCSVKLVQDGKEYILGEDIDVRIDPDADPKQITFIYPDGSIIRNAIYMFKDDDLVICEYIGFDGPRPTSFEDLGEDDLLTVYTRRPDD